ncbi:divalent cation tolerance protein CutA [Nocardia sp. BMG51109]|uniref:divalent cation tolerance protein CutA n=1 Tax=Nocardia sp. BMG51109 TaxID=1056816 RepID=UPI000A03F6E6
MFSASRADAARSAGARYPLGEGSEWRVSLRTSAAACGRLAARISELHPWGSPEMTATPVNWCLDTYVEWVERTTAGQG